MAEPSPQTATASGRDTALVALGQGALMVLGGVLALLVAQVFGKNAKTDAFFAAYGVYSIGLTFAQTFRLTAVSRLVHARGPETSTRLLGAVVVMILIAAIPMVGLADRLGSLLVTVDPGGVASATLRILWIALAGQLLGAMLATILAVRRAFAAIGVTTLLAGFVSIGIFLLLQPVLGILAAPISLAGSALWLSGSFSTLLLRTGWRTALPTRRSVGDMCEEVGHLIFASTTFLGATVAYVICIAIAARQGSGQATLFAYAYVLAVMLVGVTANAAAMVHAPAVVGSARRTRDAAASGALSFRFVLVLVGPALGMATLIGRPVLALALGSGFSGADTHRIVFTLLCLVGWILGSAAGIFAVVELLARRELWRLTALAAIMVAVLPGLALAGGALTGIEGIAAALSVSTLAVTAVQLRWAFGADWRDEVGRMLRASLRELVVIVTAFAPAGGLVAALGDTVITLVVAGALATLLAVIASRIAWPRECNALLGLLWRSSRHAVSTPDDQSPLARDDEPADLLRAL